MAQSQSGLSLWQLLQAGGVLIFALLALSVITVTIIVYNFMILKPGKLAPQSSAEDIITYLELNDEKALRNLCESEENVFLRIMSVGLAKQKRGKEFAKEAMENCARNEIVSLWQNISYLSDISTVAPLVGLLGTVIGMIQAFNAVAFQTAVLKPVVLSGGVAKAMVTTAGGLFVAIPALVFFSYFKVRAQSITTTIEDYSQDIITAFMHTGKMQEREKEKEKEKTKEEIFQDLRKEEKRAREEQVIKELRQAKEAKINKFSVRKKTDEKE
jgi:biopolymer transport protein ExbB